jgi:peptidoglycan hydrolase-like protein with peptidoglycan-binding domain
MNPPQSVLIVQYLLNCVPAGNGGPVPELVVDGMAGPKTIAAIQKFQKTNFNFADGRVDPNGKTLKALQPYDPYPNAPVVSVAAGAKAPGKGLSNLKGMGGSGGAPTGKGAGKEVGKGGGQGAGKGPF